MHLTHSTSSHSHYPLVISEYEFASHMAWVMARAKVLAGWVSRRAVGRGWRPRWHARGATKKETVRQRESEGAQRSSQRERSSKE
jgi:hypothetical protein